MLAAICGAWRRLAIVALVSAVPGFASAAEIHVLASGGLTAAVQKLIPAFERETGDHVVLALGPSMGTAPEAIPARLARGEPADVLLMVGAALGELERAGKLLPGSRVDLANSKIAAAVKAGAPTPEIATLDGFKRALLGASSIAYSDSASGVYVEREMYRTLGLENDLAPKSRMIIAERVGNVVARGEAAIGFQQLSELLPVKGIAILGEIPAEVQRVTVFSGAVPAASGQPTAGRAFIAYLGSAGSRPTIIETGLEPIVPANPVR